MIGFRAANHPQQIGYRGPDRLFAVEPDEHDRTDDRRTPPDLLAECRQLAGVTAFDLDAAATAANSIAPSWCRDGLSEPWHGRVWCNPPFSDLLAWTRKARAEIPNTELIALLLPANRTEQECWQEWIEPARLTGEIGVHFLAGRRRFIRPDWTPPAGGDRPPFGLALIVATRARDRTRWV